MAEVRATDPNTGGQKGRKTAEFALIPADCLWELAEVYGVGAQKYSADNWRKGYPWSWSYSAMQRHLNQFWQGEDFDAETRQAHLAHAAWHAFTLLWFLLNDAGTDDRPTLPGER